MQKRILEISTYKRVKRGVIMCKTLKKIQGKTAFELLNSYDISIKPPINLPKLLQNIGISAVGIDFEEIESAANYEKGRILGATISKGDSLTIFYRKDDSENRQRFTIAHELAHCCLHTKNLEQNHIELRDSAFSNEKREIDANVFAGELLIPEKSLKEIYNEFIIPSLESLAKIFRVSSGVMAARLDYLSMPYLKDTGYKNS